MNRIDEMFRRKEKNILGIYFTAGFPQNSDVVKVALALENAGVDFVEIGMPFSDPLADGPVIQASSAEALESGMTIELLFENLKMMRQQVSVPVVLMGYLNPVLQFGFDRFLSCCQSCGVDGLILPDLPLEEYEDSYKVSFERHGIYPIFLVTTRTPAVRMRKLVAASKGFVYLVSTTSTTGTSGVISREHRKQIEETISTIQELPVMVGFGIHNASTFIEATEFAHGGIVGTAFIRKQRDTANEEEAAKEIMNQLKPN